MSLALGKEIDYNAMMLKGLYIHLPFCETRCPYCNFVTTAAPSPNLRGRFFQSLAAEIKHARESCGRFSFDTLYLGGGTPSCLNIPEIDGLVSKIHAAFGFKKGYEFTCEFNPGDGEAAKLKAFRAAGVNRVSLGCQAFQEGVLQRLGRRHTARDIFETVAKIRAEGIRNISFDLMLRLPGQTAGDFRDSVKRCIELEAAQVSLYDLEVHRKTPFGRLEKEGKLDLPGEEEHARMYESAIERLGGAGYEHYEISNFAKPGMASRHNRIYWHNQEYLGLGPGAFSYLDGIRSQFAPSLDRYLEKCGVGNWTPDQEERLTEAEKETETFAMALRLREGVRPGKFKKIYPRLHERIRTLCGERLLEKEHGAVRLTPRGKFLSEDVFAFLLKKPGAAV